MPRAPWPALSILLLLTTCVGVLGRGYWTPDEPREADIAWRMSWQSQRSVPLLAGEAFCEKPPLTYWMAALPMRLIGPQAWVARLPNLFYALVTAVAVGLLANRSAGAIAGRAGAAAISTFLLSYQVLIWLATDAPLLAAVSVALLGAYGGFYASSRRERGFGYLLMHLGMAVGFLSKSAAAWLVPATTMLALIVWERRWSELKRWELYVGLLAQAAIILTWVWFVFVGPDGVSHLRVFFWNNLVGRFAHLDAPTELQYATAHRNTPGKYLIELPVYLFPWTLLVVAAVRRAWRQRAAPSNSGRTIRFGLCASLPALLVLSVAATARNIYLAPALPGVALLLAWWVKEIGAQADRWDRIALRATAAMLLVSAAACIGALSFVGVDAWRDISSPATFILVSGAGLIVAIAAGIRAWTRASERSTASVGSLLLAYGALLIGPASQAYRQVDTWQDLAGIGRNIRHDAADRPLILLAPDETTRAVIDMFASTSVQLISGPLNAAAIAKAQALAMAVPDSLFVVLVPGQRSRTPQSIADALPWLSAAHLKIAQSYALPHGRRYALLQASQ